MYLVELWKERRDGARDDHILLEEFEVEAFPESDEKMSWSSGFYFTKALRSPDDRIIWPGDQTWIDAPVKRVGFFFIPERFWQQYLQRDSTDNPPKVDLKWPWKRHDGVDVD